MTMTPAEPLTADELADFMRGPGDAWENTKRSTDSWLNSVRATIAALLSERAGLVAQVGVMVEALADAYGVLGRAAARHKHHPELAEIYGGASSACEKAVKNAPTAASALLQEVEGLRAKVSGLIADASTLTKGIERIGGELHAANERAESAEARVKLTEENRDAWKQLAEQVTDRLLKLGTRIADLERNARTPGTVEVCENHVYKQCRNHGGGMSFEQCRVKPCPIRTSRPAPAATDAKEGGE